MKPMKYLYSTLLTVLVISSAGCTDDGSDPDPKSEEEVDTGTAEQAVCGTGTYYNQCREYTSGTLWDQAGCPKMWRQNYYGECEQYKVNSQWRHEGCNTFQSYFCSTSQFPTLPSKCQPQC